ncbi:MAG: class I SAM-dependent rRNA methyltransferase [Deltaproteobacteria bacterium]|nr:class I SAM-dependent rRNA methyltransferase [Deltaproteobacteria bacterium]
MKILQLKKGVDRRLNSGHLWVYSNEVAGRVRDFDPGEIVDVVDQEERFIGRAYVNPASLIMGRILTRWQEEIDGGFIRARLTAARDHRKRWPPTSNEAYRLVFGESDGLPGLIVDVYGSFLVVQSLTAGMDQMLDRVIEELTGLFSPQGIIVRNDVPIRELEGLPLEKKLGYGIMPPTDLAVTIGPVKIKVDIWDGQKTGFFLDQNANRLRLKGLVKGKRVLDTFCYTGGWALTAAACGAIEVVGVDSSPRALALAEESAGLNNLGGRCQFIRAQTLHFLKATEPKFDVIILDPPSFAKSKSKIKEAERGYLDLNKKALKLLPKGGLLFTFSCSYQITREHFQGILAKAAALAGRPVKLIEQLGQAGDHPVLLSMPETEYLKGLVLQIDA